MCVTTERPTGIIDPLLLVLPTSYIVPRHLHPFQPALKIFSKKYNNRVSIEKVKNEIRPATMSESDLCHIGKIS